MEEDVQCVPRNLLVELYNFENNGWKQRMRWLRFQEIMGEKSFGRPHVGFVSLPHLLLTRRCLSKGIVLLDVPETSFSEICLKVVQKLWVDVRLGEAKTKLHADVLKMLLEDKNYGVDGSHSWRKQAMHMFHHHQKRSAGKAKSSTVKEFAKDDIEKEKIKLRHKKMERKATNIDETQLQRNHESTPNMGSATPYHRSGKELWGIVREKMLTKQNQPNIADMLQAVVAAAAAEKGLVLTAVTSQHLKLSQESESCQIFVGSLADFDRISIAFIRLVEPRTFPEIPRPAPTRFLIFVIGAQDNKDFEGIGPVLGTLMSDEVFKQTAFRCVNREQLLEGVESYLNHLLVIPPVDTSREHDALSINDVRDEIRRRRPPQEAVEARAAVGVKRGINRHRVYAASGQPPNSMENGVTGIEAEKEYDPFKRTGIPFFGMLNDVKRRLPDYKSDWTDACNKKILSAFLFMFFACFAPAIAFGSLMGVSTKDHMAVTETLIGHALGGIIWNIFSVQPMIIQVETGPLLVFEGTLYEFCSRESIQWDFMAFRFWIGLWIFVLAIIVVAFELVFLVQAITKFTEDIFATLISMIFIQKSIVFLEDTFKAHPVKDIDFYKEHSTSDAIDYPKNQPDTALLAATCVFMTCLLAYVCRVLRHSIYFGRTARNALADFGVALSIIIVGLIAYFGFYDTYQQKLHMSDTFDLTNSSQRGWIIKPMGYNSDIKPLPLPGYAIAAAIIPAILAFMLIFAETVLIELLVSRPDRCLKKASSYHYDIMLSGVVSLVCSVLGLPWMCAGTVQSLSHVSALAVVAKSKMPGEKARIVGVVEQRVTGLLIGIALGLCATAGKFLHHIPKSVLYGVFLYLGVVNLVPIQFIRRIFLLFIPKKYHPREQFCQEVRILRMHLFTAIQIVCFIFVYLLKFFEETAVTFPFGLLLVVLFRRYIIPRIYSEAELDALFTLYIESIRGQHRTYDSTVLTAP